MPHPGPFMPGKESWYTFYRRLGEPHSGCRKSQSPNYPACSRSLYQPHYPGPLSTTTFVSYFTCNCSYRLSPVHWCFISYRGEGRSLRTVLLTSFHFALMVVTKILSHQQIWRSMQITVFTFIILWNLATDKQKEIIKDWIYDGSCMPVILPVLNLKLGICRPVYNWTYLSYSFRSK